VRAQLIDLGIAVVEEEQHFEARKELDLQRFSELAVRARNLFLQLSEAKEEEVQTSAEERLDGEEDGGSSQSSCCNYLSSSCSSSSSSSETDEDEEGSVSGEQREGPKRRRSLPVAQDSPLRQTKRRRT